MPKLTKKEILALEEFEYQFAEGDFDHDSLMYLLDRVKDGMLAKKELARLHRGFKKLNHKIYPDGSFSQDAAYPIEVVNKLFKKGK